MQTKQTSTYSQNKNNQENFTDELIFQLAHVNHSGLTARVNFIDSTSGFLDIMAVPEGMTYGKAYKTVSQIQRSTDQRGFTSTKVKSVLTFEEMPIMEFAAACKAHGGFKIEYTKVVARPVAASIND